MPLYSYKVKNESGKVFTGETKIDSEEALKNLLAEKGFLPIEIKEKNALTDISQISLFQKRVKIKDLAVFCRQFAIILEAGVPISTALDVLREQATNPTLKMKLNDIYENIQKGFSLSNAMKQHSNIFPEILLNMVEAGEVSGQLDKVFERMAVHFEKQYKLNHKIRGQLTYPIIVSIIAILVVVILMWKVVPSFADILESFNAPMPVFTKVLIGTSDFFAKNILFFFIGFVALAIALGMFIKSPGGKVFFSNMLIRLPVIGNVTKNIITARFTRTLGTLMASGVLLIQAMEVVQKIVGNVVISNRLTEVTDEIKKGRGLTQPLANIRYFPPMVISMIRIGEESGNLDFSLDKSADFYDQEVETSLQQLTALIEPIVICFMAIVVAFIVLSVLYPMLAIYQNMEM